MTGLKFFTHPRPAPLAPITSIRRPRTESLPRSHGMGRVAVRPTLAARANTGSRSIANPVGPDPRRFHGGRPPIESARSAARNAGHPNRCRCRRWSRSTASRRTRTGCVGRGRAPARTATPSATGRPWAACVRRDYARRRPHQPGADDSQSRHRDASRGRLQETRRAGNRRVELRSYAANSRGMDEPVSKIVQGGELRWTAALSCGHVDERTCL